jgi:hypothetical protein
MVSETANNHQLPQLLWDGSTLDVLKLHTFSCRIMVKKVNKLEDLYSNNRRRKQVRH